MSWKFGNLPSFRIGPLQTSPRSLIGPQQTIHSGIGRASVMLVNGDKGLNPALVPETVWNARRAEVDPFNLRSHQRVFRRNLEGSDSREFKTAG
ncbi:hypothetical protein FKM82_023369 [Ascaphus truei]